MEFEIDSNRTNETGINSTNYNELDQIVTLTPENISYNHFFSNFLLRNVPCLIKDLTNQWESTISWIKNNDVNLDYLNEKYGNCEVTIYNCKERYFNSQSTRTTVFKDYVDYWKKKRTCTTDNTLNYLKDWHLKLSKPDDHFYEVPIYFASDWLNEYCVQSLSDDYRFVYIGVKNTWTPFHVDVFTSYSWSANISGKKRWVLFPPGEESYLTDNLGNLPYDITDVPRKHLEIIQNAGEAIFVPSGWHHQVWNLEDTVSINHNWVNGCNIGLMWQKMKNTFLEVVREIEDCRTMENFDEHCQIMLKATFGMNFAEFIRFLNCITMNRIEMLNGKNRVLFHGKKIGTNHLKFDLNCLRSVLLDISSWSDINYLDFEIVRNKCTVLANKVEENCIL